MLKTFIQSSLLVRNSRRLLLPFNYYITEASSPIDATTHSPSSSPSSSPSPSSPSHLMPPQVLIQFMPNNIFITVSTSPGSLLFKLSSGSVGMRDSAKTQPKAAMALIDELHRRLGEAGIGKVRLNFRGIGWSRGTVVGQLRRTGLTIAEITDSTGIPFNGCRPKKSRRT